MDPADRREQRRRSNGGILEDPSFEQAAQAIAVGLDGLELLESEDKFKVMVMGLLVNRAIEIKNDWNENLANQIANEVTKRIKF